MAAESVADGAVQSEQTRFQKSIQELLAKGYDYAKAPMDLDVDVSPSEPYREVLELDPLNQQAVLGLIGLSENLMTMAEFSLNEGSLETARWLLDETALTGKADAGRLNTLEVR